MNRGLSQFDSVGNNQSRIQKAQHLILPRSSKLDKLFAQILNWVSISVS